MARLIQDWISQPEPCAYLPDRLASLSYKLMVDVTPAQWDELLNQGWRRFGPAYFRPQCKSCAECVPIRIPAYAFCPSRSQQRVARRGRFFELSVGVPIVDDERVALYSSWHAHRVRHLGWENISVNERLYRHQLAMPHPCAREFAFYDVAHGEPKLVLVAIADETPDALSAVYTFYDPSYARFSLGTLGILSQIEYAKIAHKRWVYLGYRVLDCPSSAYKAHFAPHELLRWAGSGEAPQWDLVQSASLHYSGGT